MTPRNPLSCPRCRIPSPVTATACATCGLQLDWDAISDLRSVDYLLMRLEQWHRQGAIDDTTHERLVSEARANSAKLRELLESRPVAVHAPPPRPAEPPPFLAGPDEPAPAAAPRRSWLDALVEFGTVRLMLYAGALLLAVGVMIWLRDTLRVELQKPTTQAALLALFTLGVLGGGALLVARSKEKIELRIIGRGALFLGTLLLPLNPWFWLRSGLIEDRGNAWIAGLVTGAVAMTIALGLGDRVFVYLAYGAALFAGWLLTFKMTGGAGPGAYALSIVVVSALFLHAEYPVEHERAPARWRGLGESFTICGHIGIAFALVFYTTLVRITPPEIFAAFRHFDASGYSSSMGIAVALAAGYAYLYSAFRRRKTFFTYATVLALIWATALMLADRHAPDGAWLTACGAWALATLVLGRSLLPHPLWGPPLTACAKALAWTGFTASLLVAFAFTELDVDVRWFTAVGAALVALTFAIDVTRLKRWLEAFAATAITLLLAGYVVRKTGISWVSTDAVVAAVAAVLTLAIDRALGARRNATGTAVAGIRAACIVGLIGLTLPCVLFADELQGSMVIRDAPLALAIAGGLVLTGWGLSERVWRVLVFAVGGLALGFALHLVALSAESRFEVSSRFAVFLYTPSPYLLLALWFALRQRAGEQVVELAAVTRGVASLATAVAAVIAFPIITDATFTTRGAFLFAGALALLSVVPLVVAIVEKDAPSAHVEGSFASILLVLASFNALLGVARSFKDYEGLIFFPAFGAVPILFAAVGRAIRDRAPAFARAIGVVGAGVAVLMHLALTPILSPSFMRAEVFTVSARFGFILLGCVLAAHGVYKARDDRPILWPVIWSLQGAVAATMATFGLVHAWETSDPYGVGVLVAAIAVSLGWARVVERQWREFLGLTAHCSFVLGMALCLVRLGQRLELANPGLTRSIVEMGALTVAAWLLARASERAMPVYRILWKTLAIGAYFVLGVRLGMHPWHDSAYYTLPVGLALVIAGGISAQRERAQEGALLTWLGSLLAAGPLLLHALENRFILEVSPLGYDAATIGLGLLLAGVGLLFQLRAPTAVGIFAFIADLVIVVFAAIEWSSIPFSIYLTLLGLALFSVAALILFRREQLARTWDAVRDRLNTYRSWR